MNLPFSLLACFFYLSSNGKFGSSIPDNVVVPGLDDVAAAYGVLGSHIRIILGVVSSREAEPVVIGLGYGAVSWPLVGEIDLAVTRMLAAFIPGAVDGRLDRLVIPACSPGAVA